MPRRKNATLRIEDAYIHRFLGKGWRVYVQQGGVLYGQYYYYDHNYEGSSERALVAARIMRDAVLRVNNLKPIIFNGNGHVKFDSRNYFKHAGVSLVSQYEDGRRRCVMFVSKWSKDGAVHSKRFSIRKYGYQNAWKMAWKLRSEMLNIPIPRKVAPPPPEWLEEWMKEKGCSY